MLDPARTTSRRTSSVRAAWLAAAALLLGGCVAGVGFESPYYYGGMATAIYEPPPPLPIYAQPPCPGDGYLWTPGYWGYSGGYYWVPGTWVYPPQVGLLWTPGYWGFTGGAYLWHAGYWGPHVGFYGGVHYGFGYDGVGYVGGRWVGQRFVYNRYVTNVNVNVVRDTYFERVDRGLRANRVSYDGGRGGIVAYPTREDRIAARERHIPSTFEQRRHVQNAARFPGLFARQNGGRPAVAATARPGAFYGRGVVRARGAQGFQRPGGRVVRRQPVRRPARRASRGRGRGGRGFGRNR